jgi:hypothetical protein
LMAHRLFLGGNILNANRLQNFVIRQNLPQARDRTLPIRSATGFQHHECARPHRPLRRGARTQPKSQGASGDVFEDIHLKISLRTRKLVPPSKTRPPLHWRDELASPNIQNHPFKNRSKKL